MSQNPILEEIWQVKDELAREADYDARKFFENLRSWSKKHPHVGVVVQSAEDLQKAVTELRDDSQTAATRAR